MRKAAVILGSLAVLAACSSNGGTTGASGNIAVEASGDACKVAKTEASTGNVTFEVTNKGTKVTEFYLCAEGDRILGEVENIGPGLSRKHIVEVTESGKFQTACKPGMKGDGIRGGFTVTGDAKKSTDGNALLAEATKCYQRYVTSQAGRLLVKTEEFVNAVKAEKVEDAKALFSVSRVCWQRIEPVAESFGDLDPKIDGREDVIEEDMAFTGYHRREKDLWESGPQADSEKIADQLLTDVKEIVTKAKAVELTPLQLANGAKELLDEVATGKITGEEARHSHTDLWDFRVNVDGSQAAIAALRPVVEQRDKTPLSTLDDKFKALDESLEKQRRGDGFKLCTDLTQDEVKALAEAVDALGEPVSKVAEAVSAKVPFRGEVRAGITTPAQDHMHFVALDVKTKSCAELVALLKEWTAAAERMTAGQGAAESGAVGGNAEAPPKDTGEALDLPASALTITIGFGPSLFDDRFGLAPKRPERLIDLPRFPKDDLDPARSNGDICIQACANDPQVAVHAVRNLVRIGFGEVAVRWSQLGFGRTSSTRRRRATCSGSRTAPATSRPRTPTTSATTSGSRRRTALTGSSAARTWSRAGSGCTSRSGTARRWWSRSRSSAAPRARACRWGRARSSTSPTCTSRARAASR